MGQRAGTTMGYGSAPKRDTGGESVQEFMASHLIGSTDSPPPRSASVAECRTWSHGSQRMGLDANVSRKRLFGTRHDLFVPPTLRVTCVVLRCVTALCCVVMCAPCDVVLCYCVAWCCVLSVVLCCVTAWCDLRGVG